MRHIKLSLQYEGSDFSGWQVQKKEKTVQGIIEDAVFSVTAERVRLTGASRTDAGVHAFEQVAVFKTQSKLETGVLLRALNANLPQAVRIISAGECPVDFHPRFNARSKTYSYIISSTGEYAVFLRRYSWQVPYDLSIADMRKAAGYLIGRHDFACFRASGCNSRNALRNIMKLTVSKANSSGLLAFKFNAPLIKISVQADAFLRYMVRNIVGTLVEVGMGKTPPSKVKSILQSRDRRQAGKTAPAQGLFLEKIEY